MTTKEYIRLSKQLEALYNEIPEGTGLLDIVREIVEIEMLLEAGRK